MEKDKKTRFVNQPEFPGGPKALTKFIYENLRYPETAFREGVEGTVVVEYDIDHKGAVVDTRILQGLGHGCDEEAARVVRLLKFDVARNRGLRVLFHKKAYIQFKKPAPKPAPQPVAPAATVQYQYVVTTPAPTPQTPKEEKPAPPATTYTYTIKL